MTDDIVARSNAALEGITPGPWKHCTAPSADSDETHAEYLAGTLIGEGEPLHVLIAPSTNPKYAYIVPALTGDGPMSAANAEFIAAAPELVSTLAAELVTALAEVERLKRERCEFTGRLGFGDNISEPAAELADIVDPIEAAFVDARDHLECPHTCEQCGERLANTLCPECYGSGCNAAACAASGAYSECEWCGGAGWIHEGCSEIGYTEMVAEIERLRAGGPWVEHVERDRAMKRERDGECICDTGPETGGPDEFCPWHGRRYSELVEIIVQQQAQINVGPLDEYRGQ